MRVSFEISDCIRSEEQIEMILIIGSYVDKTFRKLIKLMGGQFFMFLITCAYMFIIVLLSECPSLASPCLYMLLIVISVGHLVLRT